MIEVLRNLRGAVRRRRPGLQRRLRAQLRVQRRHRPRDRLPRRLRAVGAGRQRQRDRRGADGLHARWPRARGAAPWSVVLPRVEHVRHRAVAAAGSSAGSTSRRSTRRRSAPRSRRTSRPAASSAGCRDARSSARARSATARSSPIRGRPTVKERINALVKFREEFRPFAPSILAEHGPAYFEDFQPSPYMERTLRFRDEVLDRVPGVVHVDLTGRLQTVTRRRTRGTTG